MLDLQTFLLTQDRPSGPLLLIEDARVIEEIDAPLALGTIIGQILGVAIIIALGAYFTFAI